MDRDKYCKNLYLDEQSINPTSRNSSCSDGNLKHVHTKASDIVLRNAGVASSSTSFADDNYRNADSCSDSFNNFNLMQYSSLLKNVMSTSNVNQLFSVLPRSSPMSILPEYRFRIEF